MVKISLQSHVFSPEIGHPMVKSHGEITHGVTMGIYNPMVFSTNWPPHGEIPW